MENRFFMQKKNIKFSGNKSRFELKILRLFAIYVIHQDIRKGIVTKQ